MPASSPPWVQDLRRQLKRNHGFGWSVRERHGQVQLTRRWEDATRSSVMLGIAWNSGCGLEVLNTVAALRERMESQNLSLKEAHALQCSLRSHLDGPGTSGSINWEALVEAYLASKADLRPTTNRDLRCRLDRLLSSLRKQPIPRSGPELMRRYAADHFDRCPPGGQGRKRQLVDVAAFLRFAVQRHGLPSRWNPLGAEGMAELIGTSDHNSGDALTRPSSPSSSPDCWMSWQRLGIPSCVSPLGWWASTDSDQPNSPSFR